MRITTFLLGALNRVFSRDPKEFKALTIAYSNGANTAAWAVADGTLALTVSPGDVVTAIDLSAYTIATLATHIATLSGFSAPYVDTTGNSGLGALTLLDGAGTVSAVGSDLFSYQSILYAIFEACAYELRQVQDAISLAADQLSISSAIGYWLDLLGSFFDVGRNQSETDAKYGPRIAASVTFPRCNNVAMEIAIEKAIGVPTSVIDVVGSSMPRLFDVSYAYDFSDGTDPDDLRAVVTAIVEGSRAAGCRLRGVADGYVRDDSGRTMRDDSGAKIRTY